MTSTERSKLWRLNNPERADAHRAKSLARARKYKADNPEKIKTMRADYFQRNKAREAENRRGWLAAHPCKKSEYEKRYRVKHSEQLRARAATPEAKASRNERERARYSDDASYLVSKRLRATLTQALRLYGNGRKCCPVDVLVGCTMAELKVRIERQFLDGMTWANRREWHIDHIRPCVSFDLTSVEQQRQCFHYTNLRPLWAADNLSKGAKYVI